MKQRKTINTYHKLSFIFVLGLSIPFIGNIQAKEISTISSHSISLDSIGSEIVNGERFIIHKLVAKETYYQLSRQYGVPVNAIMTANRKKNLRIGETVRIPKGKVVEKPQVENPSLNKNIDEPQILINPNDITEYKVSENETLYAISKRFDISVEDIKRLNNLLTDRVREGQILKIPNNSLPVENTNAQDDKVVPPSIEELIERRKRKLEEFEFKGNKYGIRENQEKGVGVWMTDLENNEHTSLALHKTAPIGTILKITNPMNRSVTFAKVVGTFTDTHETQGAIVILSKSVASSIGILDKRFQIEITYGVPLY